MSALITKNKRGTHLTDTFGIFKSYFNILCTVGFPHTIISARSHIVCLLSLLTADSTFVALPVFLSGGLPISFTAGFPREISIVCLLKPVMHSGDVRLVLLTL